MREAILTSARAVFLAHIWPLIILRAIYTAALRLQCLATVACCQLRVDNQSLGPFLCIYRRVVGGYHCDVGRAAEQLQSDLKSTYPSIKWSKLQTIRVYLDDQANKPVELCRSCIGVIVDKGCIDAEKAASSWRRHTAVTQNNGILVGVFPRGKCLTLELPHDGSLVCYALTILRVLPFFLNLVWQKRVRCGSTPGVVELSNLQEGKIMFVCPLEKRNDLVRFDI